MNHIEKLWDFFQFEKGEPITINGVQSTGIISSASTNPSYYNDQYFRTGVPIKTGDLIEYQNKKWIIISQPEKDIKTYRARIRESNFTIKVFIGEVLCEFNSIIESISAYVEGGKIIDTAAGEIIITIPSSEYADKVDLDMRFIKLGYAWKVSGVDRSKKGLNIIHAYKDAFISDDDKVNEIADSYKYQHHYTISASNQQPIQVTLGKTAQIIFIVTDNGSQMTTLPIIICTSSNQAIATVDNAGLITGISSGQVTITVALAEHSETSVTVPISVTETIVTGYSVAITFTNTAVIRIGGSAKPFTAVVYENGTAITTKTVTWSVQNKTGSGEAMAVLSDITGTTCKLSAFNKTASIGQKVVLTATLAGDSTVFCNLDVSIISLM